MHLYVTQNEIVVGTQVYYTKFVKAVPNNVVPVGVMYQNVVESQLKLLAIYEIQVLQCFIVHETSLITVCL